MKRGHVPDEFAVCGHGGDAVALLETDAGGIEEPRRSVGEGGTVSVPGGARSPNLEQGMLF